MSKEPIDGTQIPLDMPAELLLPCIECPLLELLRGIPPDKWESPEVEEVIRLIKTKCPKHSLSGFSRNPSKTFLNEKVLHKSKKVV